MDFDLQTMNYLGIEVCTRNNHKEHATDALILRLLQESHGEKF